MTASRLDLDNSALPRWPFLMDQLLSGLPGWPPQFLAAFLGGPHNFEATPVPPKQPSWTVQLLDGSILRRPSWTAQLQLGLPRQLLTRGLLATTASSSVPALAPSLNDSISTTSTNILGSWQPPSDSLLSLPTPSFLLLRSISAPDGGLRFLPGFPRMVLAPPFDHPLSRLPTLSTGSRHQLPFSASSWLI